MNNKPQKSWSEIQLAIAAIALTLTLAFWNMFSVPQKQQVLAQATEDTAILPPPDPTQGLAPAPTQGFLAVKIIFGGTAPQQRVVVQAAAPQAKRKSGGGGGGITTGSSKP